MIRKNDIKKGVHNKKQNLEGQIPFITSLSWCKGIQRRADRKNSVPIMNNNFSVYPNLMDSDPDLQNWSRPDSFTRWRDTYLVASDTGSWFLPIPDLGSRIQKQQQKRGAKNCYFFITFYVAKFHKIANYFSFEVPKKKIWANFQRIIVLFTQKIVTKVSKIWVWDPGSGKNLFRIPNPGVKKAPDPGSGSATLLVAHN